MVYEALVAAKALESKGIDVRVVNMHTVKPIDEKAIIEAAKETGAIVTAEEHQVNALAFWIASANRANPTNSWRSST
jgi:transketolase